MTDQTVIRFEPHGPADTGMPEWETIPQDILISNSPVQSGHEYFNRADGTSAGVWDCTAVEYKFAPYDVNEFMLVLEGSIDIIDKQGHVETFSAGDAFILPKGTPCTWRQTGYVRKYYVIFDTPHIETQSTAIDLKPIRVDLSAPLPAVGQQDASQYLSDVPEMHLLSLFKDNTAQFEVGVWDCTPMQRMPATIARSELMHILEGKGSITNADGVAFAFEAGDTFLVPIGMGYQWHNTAYVKKIFCSITPSDRNTGQ